MNKALLVCVYALLSTTGCAAHRPVWRPHKAEYANGLPMVTFPAVEFFDGDLETVEAAGGELIGFVGGSREVSLQDAARLGGTHVMLLSAHTERGAAGYSCSTTQGIGSVDTRCVPYEMVRVRRVSAVLRVPRERWPELSDALRPQQLPASLPPRCECSPRNAFGDYHPEAPYIICDGVSEERRATPAEKELLCD